MLLKDFRLALADELIGKCNPKKRGKKQQTPVSTCKQKVSSNTRFSQAPHIPNVMNSQRRCAYCSTKKEPLKMSFFCTCSVPLCIKKGKNCFQKYHMK